MGMIQFPGPPVPVVSDSVKNQPVFGRHKSPSQPNVAPGMQVLISGRAMPEFILKAAQRVLPDGRIFVAGERKAAIDRLQRRAQADGLDNLSFQVSPSDALRLPDVSIDRAYLVSVLDKTPQKLGTLKEMRRILKPEGLLSVDQRLLDLGFTGRSTMIQWCAKAGFSLAVSYGSLLHYLLVFRIEKE